MVTLPLSYNHITKGCQRRAISKVVASKCCGSGTLHPGSVDDISLTLSDTFFYARQHARSVHQDKRTVSVAVSIKRCGLGQLITSIVGNCGTLVSVS